jgi:N6-adenosine-specific RNA methylase IME4
MRFILQNYSSDKDKPGTPAALSSGTGHSEEGGKMNQELSHFDKARHELAMAQSVDEVKGIRDKAEALRAYAKQAGESLEMQNQCAEIKLRAERRAGELLKEQRLNKGQLLRGRTMTPRDEAPKLEDVGINKSQSSRWQQMADLPEEKFEEHIAKTKEERKELTTNSVLRLSRDVKEAEAKENVVDMPMPIGKYKTIVIDPPWPVQKILRDVAPNQDAMDYPVMSLEEITALPVSEIAMTNCHLFIWTTNKFLPKAIEIANHWGFRYILTMVWHKSGGFQPFDLPQYNCEFVIYARKGTPTFSDLKDFFCCFDGQRREHSRKPDEFYETIGRVTEGPRIDYFSRERRDGYEQFGNETGRFQA